MFHEGVAPALLLCVFHFPLNKLRRLFILIYATIDFLKKAIVILIQSDTDSLATQGLASA
eukprot:COSAG02_NODE_1784_length_10941_cov_179.259823_3_plen_60_part_00